MIHRSWVMAVPAVLLATAGVSFAAKQQVDARQLVPWLDVPVAWSRTAENGSVVAVPNDLPGGASLQLHIEPPAPSSEELGAAYERTTREIGRWWTEIGDPANQQLKNGWQLRWGEGVVTRDKRKFYTLVAVARRDGQLARFWVFTDKAKTLKRYRTALDTGIFSVQAAVPAPAAQATAPTASPAVSARPDAAFGMGISGVYVGVERGLSASAGVGSGPQQVFNQSTGRYEVSNTGTAPQVQTQISDYAEVDVFYPDGTYRRRLPVRGLASDMNWERQRQKDMWGTWQRQGNKVNVRRGSYTTSYTIENDHMLISDRGRPWAKIAPPSGARLDGVYARHDFRDASAPRLVLRADGTYEDRGDFLRMIGSAWNLVVPDGDAMLTRWSDAEARRALGGGSGTYIFENFTLSLRDRDGRVWQVNAYVPPGEGLSKPLRLVINGRALVRD